MALYSTLVWSYEWPARPTPSAVLSADPSEARQRRCLEFVVALGRAGYLSEAEELRLVSRIRGGLPARDLDVVAAYAAAEPSRRAGRALSALF